MRRQTIGCVNVFQGLIPQDYESRKVQAIKCRKWNEHVTWIDNPRRLIHGREQTPQIGFAVPPERSRDEKIGLRHHVFVLNKSNIIRASGSGGLLKLQREVDQRLLVPIDATKIETRIDRANFIADPMRNQRCLGIIEDDTFLAVEPAFILVNSRDDGIQPNRENSVSEHS